MSEWERQTETNKQPNRQINKCGFPGQSKVRVQKLLLGKKVTWKTIWRKPRLQTFLLLWTLLASFWIFKSFFEMTIMEKRKGTTNSCWHELHMSYAEGACCQQPGGDSLHTRAQLSSLLKCVVHTEQLWTLFYSYEKYTDPQEFSPVYNSVSTADKEDKPYLGWICESSTSELQTKPDTSTEHGQKDGNTRSLKAPVAPFASSHCWA